MGADGKYKIADFGLARAKGRDMTCEAGTDYYIAPECFDNENYNSASDIYSLWVILYQFLFGKVPPADESKKPARPVEIDWDALFEELKEDDYKRMQLMQLCKEMLVHDPEHRISLHEVLEMLDGIAKSFDESVSGDKN